MHLYKKILIWTNSEDDLYYKPSDVCSDNDIESISQEQQGSERDRPVGGDDAGMFNNCFILLDFLIYYIYH